MGDGLIFHLVCLACLTLTIAYDVPNNDIDCSSLVVCGRKTWAEKKGVCASDGNFYHTLCGMKVHECETGQDIFPVIFTDDKNDCVRGKRERRGAHHRSRRAPKHVILEKFSWQISVREHLGYYHPNISINVTFQTSKLGDTISGQGLWKAGLFRSRFEDGFGDRSGPYVQQLLSEEEASMKVRTGRLHHLRNLKTVYDLNEVGCSDFRYLCIEFSQGDNPRPPYTLTITSLTGSAVLCQEIPCYGRRGDGVDRACHRPCPDDGEPVCGDDGISYSSSCEIDNIVRCMSRDLRIAYFGECRIGVIMESMFWSAGVVSNEPGELTELEMEAFLFANESSESVAGTNLWRMGVFGSMNQDGTGPRFGYIPQILEGKSASQTLVSGLPLPIRARFRFDVATIGCNEFHFMCMEFTRNDDAEPFFPFQTNSGKDVFTSCRAAPCDPTASLSRMAVGPVTWGLTVVTARRNSPSDILLDLIVRISPDSDVIRGRGLWRVGLFGSPSANGSSDERFNYVRQLLDPSEASLPVGPETKLTFPALPAQFDIMKLGCSKFRYICLEIAKGDEPQPDFVFHNDAQKPLVFCKSVACPGPPKPVVRLVSLDWGLSLVEHHVGSPSNVSISVSIATSERSSPLNGTNLWKLGLFVSPDGSPERDAVRGQYREQILPEAAASIPVRPGMPLDYMDVPSFVDLTGMGCTDSEFNYVCISFAKGGSPDPDFDLPLRNDEAVSCKGISCQVVARYTGMGGGVRFPDSGTRLDATIDITPAPNTNEITGDGLWKVSAFGSRNPQGTGSRAGEVRNILDRQSLRASLRPGNPMTLTGEFDFPNTADLGCSNDYRYLCFEFAKGDRPSITFDMQPSIMCQEQQCTSRDTRPGPSTGGSNDPVARYSNMGASVQYPSSGTRLSTSLSITPASNTDRIVGDGLWRVSAFGSRNAQGTGNRNGEVPNILDRRSLRVPMESGRAMALTGEFDFPNAADLGCSNDYRYLCFEFSKGDRPSMRFTMQSNVMCRDQQCRSTSGPSTGGGGSTGGSRGREARYTNVEAEANIPSRGTRVSATLRVTPAADTDLIGGDGLWKVTAFGSSNSRGQGQRSGEVPDILDYLARRKTLQPPRRGDDNIMELSGSFSFPNVADLGCSHAYRYLCFEFNKGTRPSTDFTMQSSIVCLDQQCAGGSSGGTGGSGSSGGSGGSGRPTGGGSGSNTGKTVTIRNLAWAYDPQSSSSIDASVNLDVSPGSDFDGTNLWRLGLFASDSSRGTGRREDERRQILNMEDRSRSIVSGRSNTFTASAGPEIRGLGCEGKRYLCLEFGKGSRPNPPYTIQNRNMQDETAISCKIQQCNEEPQIRVSKVRPTPIEISEGERNEVDFDVIVTYDPADSTSIRGRSLWKVQAWGARTGGDVNPKISAVDQVLSSFQQDTMVEKGSGNEFRFQRLSHNFDMTGHKCPEMKFLCVRLQKQNPSPDFLLMARNDDPNRLMGCIKIRCSGAAKPMFTVSNIGIVRDPFSAGRAGRNNPMTLDINVNYDRATTTDVGGDPQWAVEAWGSAKKNGKGRKVSPSRLELGFEAHQTFELGGVLRFNDRPYDFDLTNQECQKTKFLCIKLSKTGAGFTLKGKPNSKALTKCTPYTCLPAEGSTGSKPSGGGGGGGAGGGGGGAGGGGAGGGVTERPQVTILDFDARFDRYSVSDGEVPITMHVQITSSPESGVPSGPNLWHIAVFGNSRSDGSDPDKRGYTGNVLTPKKAKSRLNPGGVMNIDDVRFNFNMAGIGCYPYNYLCMEYGKGTSNSYDMRYPPGGRAVTCSPQNCPSKK